MSKQNKVLPPKLRFTKCDSDGLSRRLENTTENGVRHNVFVHAAQKWHAVKDSASFGRDDLPLVIKVADQAHDWIFNQSGSEA
ncbi:MAG: hypothetical protein U0936_25825 [Planctomycetaceae bacterium]